MQHKCGKCHQTKPDSSFARSKARSTGRHSECMQCQVEYNRIWFAKKNYGLSKEQATQIIEHIRSEQAFCEICGELLTLNKSGYAIDHNHYTKQVRGLLCTACNKSLGGFKEDLYILEKAKQYVVKYGT